MPSLDNIEGVGKQYAAKLKKAGVSTSDALLKAAATKTDRKNLAKETGVSEKLILEWANHCDLFRIKGVAEEYADLLEEAGVDSIPELAQRKPENLHAKLEEVNSKKKLVRQLVSEKQVAEWINQAKKLKKVITH